MFSKYAPSTPVPEVLIRRDSNKHSGKVKICYSIVLLPLKEIVQKSTYLGIIKITKLLNPSQILLENCSILDIYLS